MRDWKSSLKADPTDWLLEEENPSVRYFTLRSIKGMAADDAEVKKAQAAIMKTGPVPRILVGQKRGGYWGRPEDFYVRSKYKGTIWTLILLAELGADGSDERIKKTCEFVFENSQDRESGGFSYVGRRSGGGAHSAVLPCLTGNMVWALARLGYVEDPRLNHGIEWITKYQRFDDGAGEAPAGWPYDKRDSCWGTHTCHMGVVKALKALAEIPSARRTDKMNTFVHTGAEYMLRHHIFKRSHDLTKVSKLRWLEFGFPLMWNTDALEILGVLARLGYRDSRMRETIDLVISKQDEQGRWNLDATFAGRYRVNIEKVGRPSKWITLNAVSALMKLCA